MDTKLIVSASPHLRSEETTQSLMANVIVALCPCVVASAIIFGARALLVTAVSVVACVAFEWLYCKLLKKANPISDLSAVVTGIILAMNVPVGMPIGQLIIGDLVAIIVVKQLFGGIGMNFANPALVGRIVLFISFAGSMNNWVFPDAAVDQLSSATPLAVADTSKLSLLDLFMGSCGSGRASFRAWRVSSCCCISVSMASTSSTPVWKGTSVSTTRIGQIFLAPAKASTAAPSAASSAHSR